MKLILCLLVSLTSVGNCFSKTIVEIGVASNFSELSTLTFNPFGGYFRDAIDLAIQDNQDFLNKKNITIKLKEFDYGINDLKIIGEVKKVKMSEIIGLIGYNYSSSALMAAPLHVKEKIPMLTPSATANRLGEFGKYVHLGSFNNEFMAKTLARIAVQVLKGKRVLVITAVNCAYCVDLSDAFGREIKKMGGEVSNRISVLQEDQNFKSILKEVKKSTFDLVLIPNQELTAARLISTLVEAGINKPFLGADGWGNEGSEFFRVLKGKKFTGYSVTHWHPELNTKKSKKFVQAYLKKFQKLPNDTSVLAYDSMSMLINAIGNAKSLSREGLENSLNLMTTYNGVTGQFFLSANKAPLKDILVLKTTDSGFAIHQILPPERDGHK